MSIEVTSAEFVKGVIGDNYLMTDSFPQIAFLGRSNVGKSSVINSLVGRNNLVRSSSTPGKTTEANFYRINNKFYVIDFPGYGYAKMPKKDRDKIAKRILWYVQYSPAKPSVVVLIVDMKVGLTELDEEMLHILRAYGHEVIIIANKADKLNQEENVKKYREIRKGAPTLPVLRYSAKTKKGIHEVWEKIFEYLPSTFGL